MNPAYAAEAHQPRSRSSRSSAEARPGRRHRRRRRPERQPGRAGLRRRLQRLGRGRLGLRRARHAGDREPRALDPTAAPTTRRARGARWPRRPRPPASAVATGPRVRSIGKGGIGRGTGGGPGDNGIPRAKRWVFEHPPGQTVEDYKVELDSLGIELATPAGATTLTYGSNFSTSPVQRTGLSRLEERIYTSWSSPERKRLDIELMRSAGINVGPNSVIFAMIPKKTVERIGQIEYAYKNRQPAEVRQDEVQHRPVRRQLRFRGALAGAASEASNRPPIAATPR